MSPEQATAASPVDGRSDIYSLGCVLYEMLAGRMAFSGPSLKSVLTQQLTIDPPLVHISRPDIPQNIIAIVRRCLMKQPEDALPDGRRAGRGSPRGAERAAAALDAGAAAAPCRDRRPRATDCWPPPDAGSSPPRCSRSCCSIVMFAYRRQRGNAGARRRTEGPYNGLGGGPAVRPTWAAGQADEYFSEGITDEIISQLAQVESLKVISRTSVAGAQGKPAHPAADRRDAGRAAHRRGLGPAAGQPGAGHGRADRGGERRAPVVRQLRGRSGRQLPGAGGDRPQGER